MKKILDLLEQKVQWLALALGLIYVLYMAWINLIAPPIKVTVAPAQPPMSPGEVDPFIWDKIGAVLEVKTNETGIPSEKIEVPHYSAAFVDAINYGGKRADPWTEALVLIPHGDVQLPDANSIQIAPNVPKTNIAPFIPGNGPVERLPQIPTPKMVAIRTGLTTIAPPGVAAPPAPAAGEPPPTPVVGIDKCWVTVRFEIDPTVLAKEWDACKVPKTSSATAFIQVVLERQQAQSDGSWGKETIIAPLSMHTPPAYPPATAAAGAKFTYVKWAAEHTAQILQPPFFTKIKGDEWGVPGEEVVAVAGQPAFRAEDYVGWDEPRILSSGFTPEQRRAIYLAKQAAAKQTAPRGGTRGGGPRGGARGGRGFAPNDPARPVHFQPVEPGDADQPAEQPQQPAQGVAPGNQALVVAGDGKFVFPAGEFDPHQWKNVGPIIGWAHDDTAEPGATYRYRVSYKMKNPVFTALTAVKNRALADVMALESAASEWSDSIDVASTISFFIASGQVKGAFGVHVFRWKGGEPKGKVFTVAPGDAIGSSDGEVDYATGWTVVDVRNDPSRDGDQYMLLLDPQGSLRIRELKKDSLDPRFLKLKEQSSAPPPAAGAAAVPPN